LRRWLASLPREPAAMLEVGLMFLPAIPAYLWIWPNVEGDGLWAMQIISYLYILIGTIWIGRRRWSWDELGINHQGVGLSLASGAILIAGRSLVILGVSWEQPAPDFNLLRIVGELLYYIGLVGLVEELLFRGLIYRALDNWRGVRWAIWGSSLGFILWHIFGQGPLVGLAGFLYGLIFALIRWRAGGILGLIFVHGLMDFAAIEMLPQSDVVALGRPIIVNPALLISGLVLILALPVYLWKIYPALKKQS